MHNAGMYVGECPGPTAPKSQYAPLLTREFTLDALVGVRLRWGRRLAGSGTRR